MTEAQISEVDSYSHLVMYRRCVERITSAWPNCSPVPRRGSATRGSRGRPTDSGAGQVLVAVGAAGVCGTELHFVDGLLTPAVVPITLGHEVAGTVAEVGEGVDTVAPGERVAVNYFHACGECDRCKAGVGHLCDAPLGFLAFMTDGGFAEYTLVPASAVAVLPGSLSFAEAAPLCCSAATALHAASRAAIARGGTAVVYGCGGVGLALVQVLRHQGVSTVAVSRTRAKLDLAIELGASAAVNAASESVPEEVRRHVGLRGADAVFDMVGTASSAKDAFSSLGKGGALVYVGYSFEAVTLQPLALVVPEHRVLTSVGKTYEELVEVLELAAEGVIRTVVAEEAPLEAALDVLDRLRAGAIVGRAVLVPR